ncbi:hypothetical protein [Frisingicoccus sp.]|uniref:hypothetical protein n=1 Tax=Frisingicoccus sp. TaxID=1918627 RepID=UPI0025C228AF|nr:hypothetical protein [Frisingicoccus sp.]
MSETIYPEESLRLNMLGNYLNRNMDDPIFQDPNIQEVDRLGKIYSHLIYKGEKKIVRLNICRLICKILHPEGKTSMEYFSRDVYHDIFDNFRLDENESLFIKIVRSEIWHIVYELIYPKKMLLPIHKDENVLSLESKYDDTSDHVQLSEIDNNDNDIEATAETFEVVIESIFQKYDPERGTPLAAYMYMMRNNREKDNRTKMNQNVKRTIVLDNGKEITDWVYKYTGRSFQESVSNDDNRPLEETVADPSSMDNFDNNLIADEWFYEINSQIINFVLKYKGRNYNPIRLNYYRLFYTMGILNYCQHVSVVSEPHFSHECDIVRSLKYPFIDYCMTDICRSISEIYNGTLKRYCDVVDTNDIKEQVKPIPIPLPNTVAIAFLDRVENNSISAAAFSQQKQKYQSEVRKILSSRIANMCQS